MPAPFVDLPQNITDIQLLRMVATELDTKGVVFERSTSTKQKIVSTSLIAILNRVRRFQMIEEMFHRQMSHDTHITCDTCDMRTTCRSAYDIYNTDGDCLEDK